MPTSRETLEYEFVVDARKAAENVRRFQEQIVDVKRQMLELNATSNASFRDIAEGMKRTFKEGTATSVPGKEAISQYNKAVNTSLQELNTTAGKTQTVFNSLGSAAGLVFGSILGVTAVTAVRKLIDYLVQATSAGYDFSKAMFSIVAGVNVMRRSGIDITVKDVMTNIKELRNEFRQFSEKELVVGAGALLNLTRDFGYTKDQIFELQGAIVKLAIVNGRAMDDVQRTVALAISSGYTEGLQRLGVSINRVTIAEEAARLGYGKSYLALTELQRAEATYNVILEKTAAYQDDLNAYLDSAPGKIDSMKSSWTDLSKNVGAIILPSLGGLADILQKMLNFFTRVAGGVIPTLLANLGGYFVREAGVIGEMWKVILGKKSMDEIDWDTIESRSKEAVQRVKDAIATGMREELPEAELGIVSGDESEQELIQNFGDLVERLIDLQEDANDDRTKLEQDLVNDLANIDDDFHRDNEDSWNDYYQKLEDIQSDLASDTAKAERDLAYDIEDLNRDTQQRLEDAARKYRDAELKAERDYQAKLKRLREEFLFDLEDALRERDALQVLRLIRRYNLDKQQLEDEAELEKQERAERYRQEIEDIRIQAQRKYQELLLEHQRRLEELKLQAEREKEEARIKLQEELASNKAEYDQKRTERLAQYEQDLVDLKEALAQQINEIIIKFIEANNMTAEQTSKLAQGLADVFGVGGAAEGTFAEYKLSLDDLTRYSTRKVIEMESIILSLVAAYKNASANIAYYTSSMIANINQLQNLPTIGQFPSYDVPLPPANAGNKRSGGSVLATKPTTVTFGEVPELATFTPLSQMKTSGGVSSAQLSSVGNDGGITKVEIWLSKGLEGEIIDSTLDEVAQIFQNVMGDRR